MNEALKEYIESWFEKGNNDLLTAQRLIEIEPMILDNACFHCQQAIEKYLKAYLIYNTTEIERTHNINYLLIECAKHDSAFNEIDVKDISAFAVSIRYPDTVVMPDISEVKEYYQMALTVKKIVTDRVNL